MTHAILIVDDEEHVLQSIKRLLRRDGYEIHTASGGAAALNVLATEDIAVIICDQRMPGMSGAEVLAEAYRLRPDAVRMTLTGYTDLAAARASINEGHVSHFLLKPWDDDHLRAVVRDSVRAYQLILDNRRLEETARRQKKELEAWNQRLEEQVKQRTEQLSTQNKKLQELQDQLQQSLRDTLRVMVAMLEANNPNIGIHSKRVAESALRLGAQLNLTEDDLRDVEFAAYLHDIGLVSKLHAKQGPRPERSGARGGSPSLRHSDSGHAILSHVCGFEAIAQAVRHQYENYDGTGYPDRLKEDEIPIASRIIAIADGYDTAAFSSTRSTTGSHDKVKKLLFAGQGKRFDPSLVELFIEELDKESDEAVGDAEVELSPAQLRVGMTLSRSIHNSAGVLLLKSGAALTAEMIDRIQLASNIDPVLNGVFVKYTPDTPTDREVDVPEGETISTSPGPDSAGHAQGKRDTTPKRALIVDDDMSVCSALRRELRRAGWETVCTDNGRAAQSMLEAESFDVLLVDVAMPIMSGDVLIAHVQQCWPDLPCVVLTGQASREQLVRISKAPVVAKILAKPWDSEQLIQTITSAIRDRCKDQVEEGV